MKDPAQLIDFQWYVPAEVFVVEDARDGQYAAVFRSDQSYRLVPSAFDVGFMPKHQKLGENVWVPEFKIKRVYDPFQKRVWEAFRRLRDKEDILDFIKKYGFLTISPQIEHLQIVESIEGCQIVETLEFWLDQVKIFEILLECVDAFTMANDVVDRAIALISVRRKFIQMLDDRDMGYFDQRMDKAYYYGLNFYFSRAATGDLVDSRYTRIKDEKHSLPDIERHLRGALGALFSARMDRLSPMFIPAGPDQLTVKFVPQTLLGVMWLQFMDDMQSAGFVKICPVCNRRFVIHAKMHRDRKYCSDSCKVTAWKKARKAKF